MITQVSHPVLEVHDLTVSYEQHPVLWNVDLSLPAGKLIGILGPNGAGTDHSYFRLCEDF
jgi:manganese/zinc/iron transport system ATP- binding protein